MAGIASIVNYIHPTASGIGVITSDQIWVIFDREMDESTLSDNLFVTGPDFDITSGPDLQLYIDPLDPANPDGILTSPGYSGQVEGSLFFERIDMTTLDVVSGLDTVGSGLLYRTKAIFAPTNRLQATTEYQVYLSGDEDEDDTLQTGISSRTVFDTMASGIGTGTVTFTGGYIGLFPTDTYRVQITTSGLIGDAKFTFTRDSDPTSVYGPFKARESGVLLSDGVTAVFSNSNYETGDTFSVVVKERDTFTGNLTWPFKTGSGSIEVVPSTISTSVIGIPDCTTTASTFSVSSTYPVDGATNLTIPAGPYSPRITFSSTIDPTTVVSGVDITVHMEPSTGEPSVFLENDLIVEPTASGTLLTLVIASGQIVDNALITITLDPSIANTVGTTLGTSYSYSFSTKYTPMYCTLRKMRLLIGAFISEIADDTINLAIHVASLEADALRWNQGDDTEYFNFVRSQWACCRAALMLLINTSSNQLKSKKLGDLSVTYNTGPSAAGPLQKMQDCLGKWEGALMAGGFQVQGPAMMIKGESDPDRIPAGRLWDHTDRGSQSDTQVPAANLRYGPVNRRWRRGWWAR